jgi:hypothetical protein
MRTQQRILIDEKPKMGGALFSVVAAVMLIDDLPILLIALSLNLPWFVTSVAFAVNILVFGSIFIFIHFRRVRLTDRGIVVQFGFFKSSIPLASTRRVNDRSPPRWQMISGMVSLFGGRLVYCFNHDSPFVMIERNSGISKVLYFNVSNSQAFMTKLKEVKRSR